MILLIRFVFCFHYYLESGEKGDNNLKRSSADFLIQQLHRNPKLRKTSPTIVHEQMNRFSYLTIHPGDHRILKDVKMKRKRVLASLLFSSSATSGK